MSRVELIGVSKEYAAVRALAETTLAIEPGDFVVLLGPSGAGKSTMLRTINGLETPTTGEVRVEGTRIDARSSRAARASIGMIFQQFNLVGRLNVMTNVLSGRLGRRSTLASLFFLMSASELALGEQLLARVGLVEKAWERADRLSGGQQQRVGIARALAQQPRVLLADEPVSSLDPDTADEVLALLAEIAKRDGITTIVSLHQVALARRYARRVVGMNRGEVVFDGPASDLDEGALKRIYERSTGADLHERSVSLAYA
jgi:phosphonate transport system ATP-binding protein